MSQELLGDIIGHRDEAYAARRRWYVLPLSIMVHGAFLAGVLIVPLAAEIRHPSPPLLSSLVHVMTVASVPSAPDRLPGPPAPRGPAAPSIAPTVAPVEFAPEPAGPVVPGALPGSVVESGFGVGPALPGTIDPPVEPPAPPVRSAPVRVGGTIRPPTKISGGAPVYPAAALQARLEGAVVLDATIDTRGSVEDLRVVTSAPFFDRAAIDAVRSWRFTPTLLNGVPVPVLLRVTVNFSLRR